ncbi:MAG: helix-turn-helix domain-containing protein [Acidimicrobiia bacterium]|nr:helix-turn-helix domain-containing protein [Acidimicrobiia bacterium]
MVVTRRATVRHLLTSPHLRAGSLLGGEAGLDAPIGDVLVRSRVEPEAPPTEGSVVVLNAEGLGDHLYQVDQAIRVISDSGAVALLIVNQTEDPGPSARRLANRFEVPVFEIESGDVMALAQSLRSELLFPDIEHAVAVDHALDSFDRRLVLTPEGVVEVISDLMNMDCCLLAADRVVIAGSDIEVGERRLADSNRHYVDHSHESALHSVPIAIVPGEEPAYWLIAESEGSDTAQRTLASVMRLGAWYLATILASARVNAERDARRRIALLNEILDTTEVSEAGINNQVAALGWTTAGWNIGLNIQLRGSVDSGRVLDLHAEMRQRLRDAGIDGPLIERTDGWSGWVSAAQEPSVESYPTIVGSVAEVLEGFVDSHSDLTAHAGVGRPHTELVGLRQSLGEAREASMISHARGRENSGAAHIDQIGVQRILMGWFASEDFASFAHTVLEPLIVADSDGQMVRTLEAFLDSNCSATAAASKLVVHRNTVANRIERACSILGVRLEDPETRLSLQLACRMLHLDR